MKKFISVMLAMILLITVSGMSVFADSDISTQEWADITHLVNNVRSTGDWQLNNSLNYWELGSVNRIQILNASRNGEIITSASGARQRFQYMGRGQQQAAFVFGDESFFEDFFLLYFQIPAFHHNITAIQDFGDVINFEFLGTRRDMDTSGSFSPDVEIPFPMQGFEIPREFLGREFSVTIYTEVVYVCRNNTDVVLDQWLERNGQRVDALPPTRPVEPQPPCDDDCDEQDIGNDNQYVDEYEDSEEVDEEELEELPLQTCDCGEICVLLDGEKLEFDDVAPVMVNDRTMVPIRVIAEALGAEVEWDEDTREVTLVIDGESLKFAIGETVAGMDVPAMIMNDRTFVPLRFISEFFGADVEWCQDSQTVLITTE